MLEGPLVPSTEALRALTTSVGVREDQWEASVRGGPAGLARGDRVMLEQVQGPQVHALWQKLGLARDAHVDTLLDLAQQETVPVIAGWDLTGGEPLGKLYLNASDADASTRARVVQALGWPGLDALPVPPHLVALNVGRSRIEHKAYVQFAALDPEPYGPQAAWLAGRTTAHGAYAGTVLSWDLNREGSARPRGFFVALRDGEGNQVDPLLAELPGWDVDAVTRALPFARGHCRSIGIDLRVDALRWTAYFKPRNHGVPLWNLEPVARYRLGSAHVAIFLEPARYGRRAYARTAHYALSVRGTPGLPPAVLEPLLRWAVRQVQRAEREGTAPAHLLSTPPRPWQSDASAPPNSGPK